MGMCVFGPLAVDPGLNTEILTASTQRNGRHLTCDDIF